DFNPEEEYATRIKNFLTEYPEGSQILREILQNTDDAQRPALLSVNSSIFQEDDFKSLLSLANSGKMDKYDKIGGQRGTKANFVENDMKMKPFSVALSNPLEGYYEGTIFRYPLRTDKDVADSKISAKKILYRTKSTQNGTKIRSKWQVVNYIANKNDEKYKEFYANARDCKFIPVVWLASRIDEVTKNKGRLYCFLPLPDMENNFSISINGCFAVSKNRRHLEISISIDLASDDILRRKSLWNKYLFEHVIPIAWKNIFESSLETRHCLWVNLLQNVINQLDDDMQVFRGPLGYLSIKNGHLIDEYFEKSPKLSELIAKLGIPILIIPKLIVTKLKESTLNLNYITPEIVCEYIRKMNKQLNDIDYNERLLLLVYILKVKHVYKLHRLSLLLINNETFTKTFYVASKEEFKEKIVNNIIGELSSILRNHAKNNEDVNIEILSESEFANILNKNIMFHDVKCSESSDEVIIEGNKKEWLNKIWKHLQQTNRNLANFLNVYLLPIDTSDNDGHVTLRKLGARQKCLCYPSQNSIFHDIAPILSLLGSKFINKDFEDELAKKLRIKNFKEHYFLKNKMVAFDAEILTSKFSNALEGFDQDIMVFQEFLKNADDSGATKFCVILDSCDYRESKKSLIKEEMNDWQGPSIWIFNNETFSDDDFKAICNVDCNKKPNKIGKNGLGFIACYNLTDLPQLISRDRIVFFDPQKKFLPDYKKEDRNHIINMFNDQFEPYLKLNANIIKGSLNAIKDDIANYLIFLRNIKTFEVYEKTSAESEKLLWKAEVKENDSNRKFFGQAPQEFQLDIQLTEHNERNFNRKKYKMAYISVPSNTWGGVAISISDIYNKRYSKGKYYSYLPLNWTTGLSINLHSNNWALTPGQNKFDLNHTEKLYSILENVFSPIHVKLLTEYVKYIEKEQKKADWQFLSEFLPILNNEKSIEYKYIREVVKLICEGTHKIFWSSSKG
ncbi:40860_t:CDS:10, partial [Gigaspora margarita]